MKKVVVLLVFLTVAGVFITLALISGARADRCAEELVDAVVKKDRAALEKTVKSPTLPDELLAAHEVELGFVRPMTSDETRVGLFVLKTATSTRAGVVVLVLENGETCTFVR